MTICLAAIAKEDNKEYIVFVTDHMVTTALGQFEHSIVKYKSINKSVVAMLAGNPLLFEDLTRLNDDVKSYTDIKENIYLNFINKRWEIIDKELFGVYGIDKNICIDWLQKPIVNDHMNSILRAVSEFKLNTSILLVGFENTEAQITEITEANIVDFRVMNFHAIGSGNSQAMNTLLFQKHDKCEKLIPTIYNVYKAKRNAEVLQGVGKETELLVLDKDKLVKVKEEHLNILRDIYNEELKFGKTHLKLQKLDFND